MCQMLFSDFIDYHEVYKHETNETFKNQLIAASFSTWQSLTIQGTIKTEWIDYLKKLGLVESVKMTKKEMEAEARRAMENVENALNKLKAKGFKKVSRFTGERTI